MKLTKATLKQLIREELTNLQETFSQSKIKRIKDLSELDDEELYSAKRMAYKYLADLEDTFDRGRLHMHREAFKELVQAVLEERFGEESRVKL
jgi:hypothetical protein